MSDAAEQQPSSAAAAPAAPSLRPDRGAALRGSGAASGSAAPPAGPAGPMARSVSGDSGSVASSSAPGASALERAEPVVPLPEQLTSLESTWTIWFDKRAGQGHHNAMSAYESNLKIVGEFQDAEMFWAYFNHLRKASEVELTANYHVFKDGIKPMWEDKHNASGGKWTLEVKRGSGPDLDSVFLNVLLACIGEVLDDRDEICGVVMSRRAKGDRVAVWNKTGRDPALVNELGRKIKKAALEGVSAPYPHIPMHYSLHADAMQTGASYTNERHFEIRADDFSMLEPKQV